MQELTMIRSVAAMMLVAVSLPAVATTFVYTTELSGPNEFPTNASPGVGSATVTFDDAAHTLRVETSFAGLLGNTTASHIHCCVSPQAATPTAIVATQTPTFINFPLGVQSGNYDNTFNTLLTATYNTQFVTNNGGTVPGAETALAAGLAAGDAYLNIHTTQFPGGEIRGFLHAVPEPHSYAMLGLGLLGLAFALRDRRKMC